MKRFVNPFSAKGRLSRAAILGSLVAAAGASTAMGCLDRPVAKIEPNTTNVFVEQIVVNKVDKIDLLFMIDNSISMADKQALLAEAVPQLLSRFIQPICVETVDDKLVKVGDSVDGACAVGSIEFEPINDIHVGVVSSSLGGHGGVICSPESGEGNFNLTQDDRGEQVGLLRPNADPPLTGLDPSGGFLVWAPGGDATTVLTNFTNLVRAVGESGCGYEASLEAWYRFLIDPEPPVNVPTVVPPAAVVPGPKNEVLLAQRAAFLRPDSLVAVIMLSDENDCSIMDGGVSWLVGNLSDRMPRSRAVCQTNPNDDCCRSCADTSAETACGPAAADPECSKTQGKYEQLDEPLNLRCFEQKRRFGIDFLWPVQRYIDGLTKASLPTSTGEPALNPLFAPNALYPGLNPRTDSSLIYAAAIVGVPWQDLATEDTLGTPDSLTYKKSAELDWEMLVGAPESRDPFMLESVHPRVGSGRITGPTAPPESPAGTSPVNGHEYTNVAQDDLQYACIYPLVTSRECTAEFAGGCDCKATSVNSPDRPLCQAPGTTATGITQYYAKAYPGLRFLEVLRGFNAITPNSVVASVCPKDPIDKTNQDYGYNPAVSAIVDRLKEALKGTCLPRALQTTTDAKTGEPRLACQVIEATLNAGITCNTEHRSTVEKAVVVAVQDAMKESGACGPKAVVQDCNAFTLCKLQETQGAARTACLTEEGDQVQATGYCYVDPELDENANEKLVEACDPTQRRILRMVSAPGVTPRVPFEKSRLFVACLGKSIDDEVAVTPAPAAP